MCASRLSFLFTQLFIVLFLLIMKFAAHLFLCATEAYRLVQIGPNENKSFEISPFVRYTEEFGSWLTNEDDGKIFSDEETYFTFGQMYTMKMKCGSDSGYKKQTNLEFVQGLYGMIPGPPHGFLGQGQYQEWYIDQDSPYGALSVIHVWWKSSPSDGGIVGMQAQFWSGWMESVCGRRTEDFEYTPVIIQAGCPLLYINGKADTSKENGGVKTIQFVFDC